MLKLDNGHIDVLFYYVCGAQCKVALLEMLYNSRKVFKNYQMKLSETSQNNFFLFQFNIFRDRKLSVFILL